MQKILWAISLQHVYINIQMLRNSKVGFPELWRERERMWLFQASGKEC